MISQLRIISDEGLRNVDYKSPSELDQTKFYWLEIKSDSRFEAVDYLSDFNFDTHLVKQIEDPSISNRVNKYEHALILNLEVNDTTDIYKSEYLSIIIMSNLIVSVLGEENTIFVDLIEEGQGSPPDFDINIHHVLYYMIAEILQQGVRNRTIFRKNIQDLSTRMHIESDSVQLEEIILCKKQITQLSNVVEDQYNMLGFIPKISWTEESDSVRSAFIEQIQALDHLKNSFERLEEKVNTIHLQFQLILQEKGNRRLNTLTVMQSIFVPLTFIAGIYGMNFLSMPELKWPFGYFFVLGIMVIITGLQLWLFKKKGWFD